MAAMIRLGKELALKLSCYTYQGYRSVHRAMQEGYWSAFRAYYTPGKRQAIRRLTEELLEQTPERYRSLPPPRVEDLASMTPRRGICRMLLGRLQGKRKQTWRIGVEELRFLTCSLQRLLLCLEHSAAPPLSELFALQGDLCHGSGIVDVRCQGMPELKRSCRIEHFDRTEWVPHLQLWEILGDPAPAAPGGETAKAAS
jgi:hypothetical protein